jgi:hypothetical protein
MARKLDRSRPFNTSYGETNLRFHQDGRYFDPQGREVDTNGALIPDPPAESPVPAPTAPSPPVAPTAPNTAPSDDEDGPGVSVDQALGAEPTVEPAPAAAPDVRTAPSNEGAGGATSAADPKAAEPRAILENMTLEELRMLGKRANAPAELLEAKGKEARDPLITWLVEHGT